jgi:hypothetical protein
MIPIKSWVYPERKKIKARRHQIKESKINRVKEICILAGSITERKQKSSSERGKAESQFIATESLAESSAGVFHRVI